MSTAAESISTLGIAGGSLVIVDWRTAREDAVEGALSKAMVQLQKTPVHGGRFVCRATVRSGRLGYPCPYHSRRLIQQSIAHGGQTKLTTIKNPIAARHMLLAYIPPENENDLQKHTNCAE
jgi:hypothetical protein